MPGPLPSASPQVMMLRWFKKKPALPPSVQFARAVGYSLDWWLLGLGDDAQPFSQDERVLESALGLHGEGRSIRSVTCHLANVLAGDLIQSHSELVRKEVLSYLREPGVMDALLQMNTSEVVMTLDLFNGPNLGELTAGAGMRAKLWSEILTRGRAEALGPQAGALFLGVRHLWERALVATVTEKEDDDLRASTTRLTRECLYALEGSDAAARKSRHWESIIEDATRSANAPATHT
jgi:hypothetical protein